ncbi:prolyl oligopeptidase family serine peptidase [Daejeonella sp.]|jgi:dipeptidyl aminopeptidase/acylaminoacyl peptidase|uniref:S9 family peptidase n=1 Tax=Daejeonella sp. TaxID=2805397 RepID=UPI0037831707
MFKQSIGFLLSSFFCITASLAQENNAYQKPPQALINLLEAPINEEVILSSDGQWMLLLNPQELPSITELSSFEYGLAGLRIDPITNGPSRAIFYTGIRLKSTSNGAEYGFSGLPLGLKLSDLTWSPDESKIAFCHTAKTGIELWMIDLKTQEAKRLGKEHINRCYGKSFIWKPDGKAILAQFVINELRNLAEPEKIPSGPLIQENTKQSTPSRTYQDLLKNPFDEKIFEHFFTSQLKTINLNGESSNFLQPQIVRSIDFSPDGDYLLLANIQRPYSYTVPIGLFPFTTALYDKKEKLVKKLFEAPLAENIPLGFDAVPKGPREFAWRADKGATLYWIEALDNGNPAQQASIRDIIYTQAAPFNQNPLKLADCYFRFHSILWSDDKLAIITERWWKTRTERRVFIKPSDENFRINLFDRYFEDAYQDPGELLTKKNEFNRNVLLTEFNALKRLSDPDNIAIFSISDGASADGDRPFILKFNIKTKIRDTIFRSTAPYYERPLHFNNTKFIINSREAADTVKNYFKINLSDLSYSQITNFPNPYPELNGVQKKQISYERLDGIKLGATLYLPANFKTGAPPLPVLMWAYPREFKTMEAAAQVKGSPYTFSILSPGSPLYWVSRGYAILDNADMPIIGESIKEPNDTFIEQIRYNAEAAINQLVKMGVADRNKIAIGGHSYGAFMTANLLAHTDLFAAGIAQSGAYNRSLTPFGFQSEERTFWQATTVYNKISPFNYANKIKSPLLLIHGQADNNADTFPLQSERLFAALKGHGTNSRLVLLPFEAHRYSAKESILHTMWEMDNWLEKYVKNK